MKKNLLIGLSNLVIAKLVRKRNLRELKRELEKLKNKHLEKNRFLMLNRIMICLERIIQTQLHYWIMEEMNKLLMKLWKLMKC